MDLFDINSINGNNIIILKMGLVNKFVDNIFNEIIYDERWYN